MRQAAYLALRQREVQIVTSLVVLALCARLPLGAQTTIPVSPLWHDLTPGLHRVGFRVLNVVDTPRSARAPRVVRVALWYPAAIVATDSVLAFGEYLDVRPDTVPDPKLEAWHTERNRDSIGRQFFDSAAASHQVALLQAATVVAAGARSSPGTFPLVLHSLGRNGGQFQHTILWEYLASHGFVVASVAQFGRDLANPGMEFTLDDLRIQQADMRVALRALAALPFVDSSRVATLGHSSGALVALWIAADEPSIKAVVGLDGSINRSEGRNIFTRGLAGHTISAPFLNICRWPHDEYVDYVSRHLRGQLVRIGYERAVHFDFQNWPAYLAFADSTEPSSAKVRSVADARRVFESTAVFTRLFLEAHLKDDDAARSALTDPAHVAELSAGLATVLVARQ